MPTHPHIEVIARGLITRGSKVLVCRNIQGNYCYLPGGHVEFGEPAALALSREIQEETGLDSSVGALLLLTEHTFSTSKGTPHHELNMVFHVEHLAWPEDRPQPTPADTDSLDAPPPPIASLEADLAFDWVELAALPELELLPAEIKAWLMTGGETESEPGADPIGWISRCDPTLIPPADKRD